MEERRYETLVLLDPDLSPEELEQTKQKFTDIVNQMKGGLLRWEDWGRRPLAYPVHKQLRGYYWLLDFSGYPTLLTELERQMRLDERVYKYLTLVLDKDFTEEKRQAEVERIQSERTRRETMAAEEAARQGERENMRIGEDETESFSHGPEELDDGDEDENDFDQEDEDR